jgi:hypothetical protein
MDLGKLSKLSEHRKCLECGMEFDSNKEATALQQFCDHKVRHQPDGDQWKKAYEKIQERRPKKTGAE